jgi:hypothetical protein
MTLKEALWHARRALALEIHDSVRLEAALRAYANGWEDGGQLARETLDEITLGLIFAREDGGCTNV